MTELKLTRNVSARLFVVLFGEYFKAKNMVNLYFRLPLQLPAPCPTEVLYFNKYTLYESITQVLGRTSRTMDILLDIFAKAVYIQQHTTLQLFSLLRGPLWFEQKMDNQKPCSHTTTFPVILCKRLPLQYLPIMPFRALFYTTLLSLLQYLFC